MIVFERKHFLSWTFTYLCLLCICLVTKGFITLHFRSKSTSIQKLNICSKTTNQTLTMKETCSQQYPWSNCGNCDTDHNNDSYDVHGSKKKKTRRNKKHDKGIKDRKHALYDDDNISEDTVNLCCDPNLSSTYLTIDMPKYKARAIVDKEGTENTNINKVIEVISGSCKASAERPENLCERYVTKGSTKNPYVNTSSESYMDMRGRQSRKPHAMNLTSEHSSEIDSYGVHKPPVKQSMTNAGPELNPQTPHDQPQYDYATLPTMHSRLPHTLYRPDDIKLDTYRPPPVPPRKRYSFLRLSDVPHDIGSLSVDEIVDSLRLLNLDNSEHCVRLFRKKQIDGRMLLKFSKEILMKNFGLSDLDAFLVFEFAHESWRPNDN